MKIIRIINIQGEIKRFIIINNSNVTKSTSCKHFSSLNFINTKNNFVSRRSRAAHSSSIRIMHGRNKLRYEREEVTGEGVIFYIIINLLFNASIYAIYRYEYKKHYNTSMWRVSKIFQQIHNKNQKTILNMQTFLNSEFQNKMAAQLFNSPKVNLCQSKVSDLCGVDKVLIRRLLIFVKNPKIFPSRYGNCHLLGRKHHSLVYRPQKWVVKSSWVTHIKGKKDMSF